MKEKKLPELVDKHRIDEAHATAASVIQPFLKDLHHALQIEGIEVTAPELGIEDGERTFTTMFRGHRVMLRSMGARPGRPFGLGVDVFIDGVEINSAVGGSVVRELEGYLADKLGDTVALDTALKLRDLAAMLSKKHH